MREGFNSIYNSRELYRQTGIVLAGLVSEENIQRSLFDDIVKIEKLEKIYKAVDSLSERFGKHTIQHASSMPAKLQAQHEGDRGDSPQRKANLFKVENRRQRLGLPVLNIKV